MAYHQDEAFATTHGSLVYGHTATHNTNDDLDTKHYLPLNMTTQPSTAPQVYDGACYDHVYLYPPPLFADSALAFSDEKSAPSDDATFISPNNLSIQYSHSNLSYPNLTAIPAPPTPAISGVPESSYDLQSTRHSSPSPFAMSDDEDDEDDEDANTDDVKPLVLPSGRGRITGVWAQLIFQCLLDAPNHEATLRAIYEWMKTKTSRCDGRNRSGWENSVRHNLSMNPAFQKGSSSNDFDDDDESNNQHVWHLEPWAITQGVKPTTRYRKGHNTQGDDDDDEDDMDGTTVRRSAARRGRKITQRNVRRSSGVTKRYNKKQVAGSRGGKATAEHDRRITRFYKKLLNDPHHGREPSAHPADFSRSATPSPVIASTDDYASSFDDAMSVSASSYAPSHVSRLSTEPYYLTPHQRPVMPASVARMPPMQRAMTASPFAGATHMMRITPPLRAQSNSPFNPALQPFLRRQMSARQFKPVLGPHHGVSSPWQYALRVSNSAVHATPELVVADPAHQMMHTPMSGVVGHHDVGIDHTMAAFDNDVPDMDIGEGAYPALVPHDVSFTTGFDTGLGFESENAALTSPNLFSTYMYEHHE